jgi:hypothetical protein
MAGAFGGGGCYSTLSQLGFLRGLLADDLGGADDGIKLTAAASSSGASWGLGMFFNNADKGGLLDVYLHGDKTVTGKSQNDYWKNELGTWCMYHSLHTGMPRHKWAFEMQACGKCAATGEGCADEDVDPFFGVADRCIKGKGGPAAMDLHQKEERMDEKYWGEDEYLEFSGPGRQAYLAGLAESYYNQFFKKDGETKEEFFAKKLSDLSHVFQHDNFGETQWSLLWSHWNAIVPPFQMADVIPGSSGPATRSDENFMKAVMYSSDANGMFATLFLFVAELAQDCKPWLKVIGDQTEKGAYPFPFSYLSRASLLSSNVTSLLQTEGNYKSDPLRVPRKLLNRAQSGDPKDLMQFYVNTSSQQRRGALSEMFQLGADADAGREGFGYSWNVDGGVVDTNTVGETLRLMENVPPEQRQRTLTAMMPGNMNNDDSGNVKSVLSYFKPERGYGDMVDLTGTLYAKGNEKGCASLANMKTRNPNYFFKWDGKDVAQLRDLPERCTTEVMLSRQPDSECWNLKYQADKTGIMFVQNATVVENEYWGIKGGWDVTLLFVILSKNDASIQWINDVYGDRPEDKKALHQFPIVDGGMNNLMGVDAFQGFALMNYNAYKGYMAYCALVHFHSGGDQECKYCQEHREDCHDWLPYTKKKE